MSSPHTAPPLESLLENRVWLRALAHRLVADPHLADDLVQDTLVAALEQDEAPRSPRGWLAGVLRNLASKHRRAGGRRRRRHESVARPERVDGPDVGDLVARAELQQQLGRRVLELPPTYREVLLLRFFEGLPPRDIARRLDLPVETVRTRTRRAIERLRAQLDDEHDGRSGWVPLLTALASDPSPPPFDPPASGDVAGGSLVGGLVAMSTTTKLAAVAVVLLVLGLVWMASDPESTTDPPRTAEVPAADEGDTTTRARPRHHTAGDASGTAAETEPTATTPAPVDLSTIDRERDLHGRVIDETGNPVAGARLRVLRGPWEGLVVLHSGAREQIVTEMRSATDGSFRFRLPPGRLAQLRVSKEGHSGREVRGVQAGERIEVVLPTAFRFQIEVLDPDGRAAPGTRVRIFDANDDVPDGVAVLTQVVETGADGRAWADGRAPGARCTVDLVHPVHGSPMWLDTHVPEDADTPLQLQLVRARRLTGRVTDAATGEPVPTARVAIGWMPDDAAEVGADGTFTLDGWTGGGVHTIAVRAPGYARQGVVVGGESHFDVALRPAVAVRGRVVDPDGAPVEGVRVALVGTVFEGSRQRTDGGGATTAADGRFVVRGLSDDLPYIAVLRLEAWGRTVYDLDPPAATDGVHTLPDLVIQPAGELVGRIVDADGRPHARAQVRIRGANGDRTRHREAGDVVDTFYGGTEFRWTDDLGRFRLPDLAPGTYTATVTLAGGRELEETAPVFAGTTSELELVAPHGQDFTVRVRTLDGEVPAGAHVVVHDDAGEKYEADLDGSGTARFPVVGAPRTVAVWPRSRAGGERLWASGTLDVPPGVDELEVVLRPAATITGSVRLVDLDYEPEGLRVVAWQGGEERWTATVDAAGEFTVQVEFGSPVDLVLSHVAERGFRGGWIEIDSLIGGRLDGVQPGSEGVVLEGRAVGAREPVVVRVFDADGAPLAGSEVRIIGRAHEFGRGRTDASGELRVGGLPAIPLRVLLEHEEVEREQMDPGQVSLPIDRTEVELRLVPTRRLAGLVLDAAGQAAAGATVTIWWELGGERSGVEFQTDADGRYEATVPADRAVTARVSLGESDDDAPSQTDGSVVIEPGDPAPVLVLPRDSE